ncbi:unnamed protein product [Kuraishia capsulata CBS 1993]|uniref:Nitrate/nitrite transporter n=1 Tax=Kuraishia capsulata CBS 1993 TaxID=1382522 RepID=W6MFQ5_9ASCO|nr:uncharacterized protein KUCA_T00000680001 [Kuraishia capsulata CBS 1993]CDK24714.1 unnamed protein product [Kuraishia capsulata CBS 1993]
MKFSSLYRSPELNPKDLKALTIPIFNPINVYGRCFHLSWLGFFVCFLSWFAFPPLLHGSLKKDLNLTAVDIANDNICGLSATLIARFVLGPLCDKFGPRWVMAGTLIVGAIPTAFCPLVTNVSGLHAIRFFIGFLGGSFVPCQMWTTVFFDKTIVGTANALAGGWGNAGGGVAFFMMPALVSSLLGDGYSLHRSWGLAFTVGPFVILVFVAALVILFGQDCPEGKWSKRKDILGIGIDNTLVTVVSVRSDQKTSKRIVSQVTPGDSASAENVAVDELIMADEIIEDPTLLGALKTSFSYRTMLTALCYLCTFGGELAIEAILSGLYSQKSPKWSQSLAGDWGSMMGLLNIITRPLGGVISDLLYRTFKTTKVKKFWMIFCGFMQGVFLLWIGLVTSLSVHGTIGALAAMSVFMEMGNGANFSTVYFINKKHPGIVAGTTGAFGNLGGIVFSLVFRYNVTDKGTSDYGRSFYIIGAICMGLNALVCFIPIREDKYVSAHHEAEGDVKV